MVGLISVVAPVFAGQQVRDVTEVLESRPGPCSCRTMEWSRGDATHLLVNSYDATSTFQTVIDKSSHLLPLHLVLMSTGKPVSWETG